MEKLYKEADNDRNYEVILDLSKGPPMKMQFYMIVVRDECYGGICNWHVDATSDDYNRLCQQYDVLKEGGRMLLSWHLLVGIEVLKVNHGNLQYVEGLNDLKLPWYTLPADERSGMVTAVHRAVVDFLK
jgi:hypothetical protein